VAAASLVAAAALATPARASDEVPSADTRAYSMGGVSQGNVYNPAALASNPAQLDAIRRYAVHASAGLAFVYADAPVNGPNTNGHFSTIDAGGTLSGAMRLSDRLVVGLLLLPASGTAGDYDTVAGKLSLTDYLFEGALGASFAISDAVSIGAEYRVTYAGFHQMAPIAQPAPGSIDFKASGFNFLGFGVGLHVRPDDQTSIGLSYRSRVVAGVSGTAHTTIAGQTASLDGETSLATPDRIALGGTRDFLDHRLVLGAETGLLLQAALPSTTTTIGNQTIVAPNERPSIWNPRVGGEFWVTPAFAIRAGGALYTYQTSAATPSYFSEPPALDFLITAGAGLRLGKVSLDGVVVYEPLRSAVSDDPVNGSAPGRYARASYTLGAAANFEL